MTTEHSGSGDLTRSLDLLWGTKAAPSRGPKRGLSQEQIVATAVALANSEGLAALSMRRVASELGVGTMSLYRYVPGKGELLDLMIDHVNAPDDATALQHQDWRSALRQVATGSWELYTGNPWLLQVNQVRPVLGPNSLAGFDITLGALDGLGLTGQEKVALIVTLDNYVVGAARSYVLEQQAALQSGTTNEEFWSTQEPYLVRALESGAYPHMLDLPEDAFAMSAEDSLRFGVDRILDGFAALIDSRASGASD